MTKTTRFLSLCLLWIASFAVQAVSSEDSSDVILSRTKRQSESRTYRLPSNPPPPDIFTNSTLPPKGEPGLPGDRGRSGPPGIPGENGDAGPRGLGGKQGNPGTQGSQGSPGPPGNAGPSGITLIGAPSGTLLSQDEIDQILQIWTSMQRQIGTYGRKGQIGAIGLSGEIGAQGLQGERGPRGAKGIKGEMGPLGDIGPTGDAGRPGKNVSI
ncbi:Collagen alpha-1(VII) chain [Porites harrisoni]